MREWSIALGGRWFLIDASLLWVFRRNFDGSECVTEELLTGLLRFQTFQVGRQTKQIHVCSGIPGGFRVVTSSMEIPSHHGPAICSIVQLIAETNQRGLRDMDQWQRMHYHVTITIVVFNKPQPCSTHQLAVRNNGITDQALRVHGFGSWNTRFYSWQSRK